LELVLLSTTVSFQSWAHEDDIRTTKVRKLCPILEGELEMDGDLDAYEVTIDVGQVAIRVASEVVEERQLHVRECTLPVTRIIDVA
jgi:fructose-bisphosphate aldolase class 1